jgi:FkbM family methyltransferase
LDGLLGFTDSHHGIMRDFITTHLPASLAKPIISFGRYIRYHTRTINRLFRYGYHPYSISITTPLRPVTMVIHPFKNGCVDEHLSAAGVWEPDLAKQLVAQLSPGDTFIDIGANIGYHTLFVAGSFDDRVHIHAFEPQPSLCRLLRRSVTKSQLRNVHVHETGLGDAASTALLSVRRDNIGSSSVLPHTIDVKVTNQTPISIQTLDSHLPTIGRVTVIKIDVEGFEYEALRGGQTLLQRDQPTIFLEFSPALYELAYPGKTADFIDFLTSIGYSFFTLTDEPIDLTTWARSYTKTLGQIDVMCRVKVKS